MYIKYTELFLCDEDFYREIERFLWCCFLDCCTVASFLLVLVFCFCLVCVFYRGAGWDFFVCMDFFF